MAAAHSFISLQHQTDFLNLDLAGISIDIPGLGSSFSLPPAHSLRAACPCSVPAVLFVCEEDHEVRAPAMVQGYKRTAGCRREDTTALTGFSRTGAKREIMARQRFPNVACPDAAFVGLEVFSVTPSPSVPDHMLRRKHGAVTNPPSHTRQ